MALNYHVVPRKVLSGENKGRKMYFAQVRAGNIKDFDQLCTNISRASSATRGDVELVLNGMVHCLTEYLKDGNIVQMAGLGNFRISAGSKGVEREEDFSMHLMREPKIVFTPGKVLRRLREKIQFRKMEIKTVFKGDICEVHPPTP